MQPYQEEYIANLKEISLLSVQRGQDAPCFEAYLEGQRQRRARMEQVVARNMSLLRENLFPLLDRLFEAGDAQLVELEEFAAALFDGRSELDVGLFRQIYRALLSRSRLRKSRNDMIRQLYWLGMGYNCLCTKLMGLENAADGYTSRMRLCFMEAAAYLKYFDEIEDSGTKGYILRSRANVALGQFKSPSEKIQMVKYTLKIMQDKEYQEKAPELPWNRFIYMTHLQMVASLSRSRERAMTPQDIAAVMESVYIVYQQQLAQAQERGERPPARISFSYDSINYYCGLDSLDGLLGRMELLMDRAEDGDYSAEGIYAMISLPAFYCNFLQENPEKVPERREYLDSLYRRATDYAERFPQPAENETLFFALRQMTIGFVETGSGLSYGDLLQRLLVRFLPEMYVHSHTVGRTAAAFCRIVLEEEPGFFDDMDSIREITDFHQKEDAVSDYAMKAGLFHDMGKISFPNLYSLTARQWFEEEYELASLHTRIGEDRLSRQPSTRPYAPVALGHHAWYDGSGGYPDSYVRLECPCRQMVDIIGLVDWLDNVTYTTHRYTGMKKTFPEAVREAIRLGGKRFSPLLTGRLEDPAVERKLAEALEGSRREAYRRLYEAFPGRQAPAPR